MAWRYLDDEEAWASRESVVPLAVFGDGAKEDWSWYFEGQSRVLIRSTVEISDWLLGCSYTRDSELFHRDDYWQHPLGFEALRRGDCEDHALWAWRKLVELGYDAELVSGRSHWNPDHAPGGHCWVVFRNEGQEILLEATTKRRELMLRPLSDGRGYYEPHASVDQRFRRRLYAGYVKQLKELRDQRVAERKGQK
jgi:hypothetical protein